jgi:UDP-N-acetylglucosamine:LPS N-acetylglucosamine transferase
MKATAGLAYVLVLLALAPPAAAQIKPKNVLVLSGGRGRVSINQMQSSLRTRFPEPVNFSIVVSKTPDSNNRLTRITSQKRFAAAMPVRSWISSSL